MRQTDPPLVVKDRCQARIVAKTHDRPRFSWANRTHIRRVEAALEVGTKMKREVMSELVSRRLAVELTGMLLLPDKRHPQAPPPLSPSVCEALEGRPGVVDAGGRFQSQFDARFV